jgi:hypothetical protein
LHYTIAPNFALLDQTSQDCGRLGYLVGCTCLDLELRELMLLPQYSELRTIGVRSNLPWTKHVKVSGWHARDVSIIVKSCCDLGGLAFAPSFWSLGPA